MKRFNSIVFLIILFFSTGRVSSAQSQETGTASILLNQEVHSLSLESKVYETLYRTDQVPDVCYRSEIQGSRTECHMEYERQCQTQYQQQCGYRTFPVCQTVPRNVCQMEQVCHSTSSPLCHGRGCTQFPRRECRMENRCRTIMDHVCHNEQRWECQTLPQTFCQDVPRQVCMNVPNVVQVPYSCTKPVQVAIGQALKLHTAASVSVRLANYSEVGALQDSLLLTLSGDQIKLQSTGNRFLLQVIQENRSEQFLSPTEKVLQVNFILKATPVEALNEFALITLRDGTIGFDRITFQMSRTPTIPFQGHLELTRHRALFADKELTDRDFDPRLLVSQGTLNTLMLSSLGVSELKGKRHKVKLRFAPDLDALRRNAVNPSILNLVSNSPVILEFEGTP